MGSFAGGEQSATQPASLLQLAKSPPDEELELVLEEVVVVPELLEVLVIPELDAIMVPELDAIMVPELLAEPAVPPVAPDPMLVVPVAPPVPLVVLAGSPALAQAVKRGT